MILELGETWSTRCDMDSPRIVVGDDYVALHTPRAFRAVATIGRDGRRHESALRQLLYLGPAEVDMPAESAR